MAGISVTNLDISRKFVLKHVFQISLCHGSLIKIFLPTKIWAHTFKKTSRKCAYIIFIIDKKNAKIKSDACVH